MVQKPCLDGFSEKRNRIGIFFFFHFLTVTGIERIKVNIVGPDLSKVSETWSKNIDNLICTFFSFHT